MEIVTATTAAEAARLKVRTICWAPGEPCELDGADPYRAGDHLRHYTDAWECGTIASETLMALLAQMVVFTEQTVVPTWKATTSKG